ncbi:MAG: hypothetical protein WC143_04400 [Eubacteriales bacterium]
MFEKSKLKRKIKNYHKMIEEAEQKRIRSQAALVEAILTHEVPSDDDVDYFNKYTGVINDLRAKLRELQEELESAK